MDLVTVRTVRTPTHRDDLALAPGERPLGGGTWLHSEEQPGLTGLVDLTTLGWPDVERTSETLTIAATCTIATLVRTTPDPDWTAWPLVGRCANALLASFKIWNAATVGGNVAVGLPAGAMIALLATLDATAVVWTPDGAERRTAVEHLVQGVRTLDLRDGEVLRAFEVPVAALRHETGYRRVSLSPHGRSGALVTARWGRPGRSGPPGSSGVPGGFTLVITAATPRPVVLRFDAVPSHDALAAVLADVTDWYDDPHGSPAWRRAVSVRFAHELRDEAAASVGGPTGRTGEAS
ncbi:FAD binding domain-containing protein [Curtobacterium sp. MCBD17_035]|uniref:FAD binding domain-containing protein n=1 Tax=Curtobacterium sp. MCBD17_035 TaxID=2175673 RepID=UPI000DA8BF82|nr:FAD binding domain-containing protein [Curtobacterium sp. MCBD17_035]WIB68962.1 FAD binding domain-containing protein [Curtobacterium sp. MCBD17_035]